MNTSMLKSLSSFKQLKLTYISALLLVSLAFFSAVSSVANALDNCDVEPPPPPPPDNQPPACLIVAPGADVPIDLGAGVFFEGEATDPEAAAKHNILVLHDFKHLTTFVADNQPVL